jgi:hypothetical protein
MIPTEKQPDGMNEEDAKSGEGSVGDAEEELVEQVGA